jgi:hypothetical protein
MKRIPTKATNMNQGHEASPAIPEASLRVLWFPFVPFVEVFSPLGPGR